MSTPKNPNAFPLASYAIERGNMREEDHPSGMSLRDYFAAKAMQGICSTFSGQEDIIYTHRIAKDSYDIADAMLKAREL
jgi:hypothetical protein